MLKFVLIVFLALSVLRCTSTEVEQNQILAEQEVENDVIEPKATHKETNFDEFLSVFPEQSLPIEITNVSTYCFNIKSMDTALIKDWLVNNSQSSELAEIFSHSNYRILPLFKLKNHPGTICFSIQEETNDHKGLYDAVWMVKYNVKGEILSYKDMLFGGQYEFTEKSEELGEAYEITTKEIDQLSISLETLDSINVTQVRYTLKKGQDWRVDQNLKINDSVALPTIQKVFSLL